MGSSCGFNAFVVTESWYRYSSDSWLRPYPQLPGPFSLRAPVRPGLTTERDNTQHGHSTVWSQVTTGFKDLSGHGTDRTERHLTDEECFGTQHSQTRALSPSGGDVCGVRKSQITLMLESCLIQLSVPISIWVTVTYKCSFCLFFSSNGRWTIIL